MKYIKKFEGYIDSDRTRLDSILIKVKESGFESLSDEEKYFINHILKKISQDLAETMHCDRYGSCVHFAEEFILKVNEVNPELLNTFYVIEGYVNWSHGDGIPQQHTWIELESGEKIDPTYIQFTKYGSASYSRKIKSKFTGLEYYNETIEGTWFSERRKKYPEMFFK